MRRPALLWRGRLAEIWTGILPGMRGCRPLTQDEINRVLAAFDGPTAIRERAIFITALRTGMRISSILSLRVEDVAHEGKVRNRIRVRRATVKGKRSGYDIALHAEAAAALQKQINSLKDTRPMAFVFPGRYRGTPLNRIRAWKSYKAALAKAGIVGGRGELGMHATRKTYAKRVFAALGHDLVRTAYALRHSCVSTTIRYISFEEEDVDRVILEL